MKIYVDAEAGQTIDSFAMELCWIARRLDIDTVGRFDGTDIEAVAGSAPSDLVRLYYSQRVEFHR